MIIATLTSLFTALNVQAANPERWFEVEVYIFKHDNANTERWAETILPIKLRGNVDLITPIVHTEHEIQPAVECTDIDNMYSLEYDLGSSMMDDCVSQEAIIQERYPERIPFEISQTEAPLVYQGSPASLLALSQSQFKTLIKKINAKSSNQNLLHMTWQQAMLPKRKAKALHIFAGNNLSHKFQPNGFPVVPEVTNSELELNSLADENIDIYTGNLNTADDTTPSLSVLKPQNTPLWQLDGKLNIYLNHYLYIEADLRLREPGIIEPHPLPTDNLQMDDGNILGSPNDELTPEHVAEVQHFLFSIPLIQNRRVRSNEVHYFDHPKMGMFIQIRKMTQPIEKPAELINELAPKLQSNF